MTKNVLSTYEVAKICNSHHTTIINWVKSGKLKGYVTPGGHRRIKKSDLIDFMKRYEIPIPQRLKEMRKSILVVDDDFEALREFKEALSGHKFDLDFATNGFEAGRKIYRKKPDLILLDFRMPGMDGFQVCKVLHNDKDTASIPIIAVTVLTSKEDVAKIKKCGVKEYVPKPVDIDRLIKLIGKILVTD